MMDESRQFKGPNLLMLAGIVPIIIAGILIWLILKSGNESVYYIPWIGTLAYLLTLAISVSGWLWADRILRVTGERRPALTSMLVKLFGLILILPWVIIPIVNIMLRVK